LRVGALSDRDRPLDGGVADARRFRQTRASLSGCRFSFGKIKSGCMVDRWEAGFGSALGCIGSATRNRKRTPKTKNRSFPP
jgi:hypothetical protein